MEGFTMTSTYRTGAADDGTDAAVDRTARAIVKRVDQLMAQSRSRDPGPQSVQGFVPQTAEPTGWTPSGQLAVEPYQPWNPDWWMLPVAGKLIQAVAQAAPGIVKDIAGRYRSHFGFAEAGGSLGSAVGSTVDNLCGFVLDSIESIWKGTKGVPRDAAELQSRFLQGLIPAVLSAVAADAVPTLIGSLSGLFRDVPPTLTDLDEEAWFSGSILSHFVPSLVQVLPDIVGILTGKQTAA
jgi:hypothetical protein